MLLQIATDWSVYRLCHFPPRLGVVYYLLLSWSVEDEEFDRRRALQLSSPRAGNFTCCSYSRSSQSDKFWKQAPSKTSPLIIIRYFVALKAVYDLVDLWIYWETGFEEELKRDSDTLI